MNAVRHFHEYRDDNGILRGDEYEGVTGIWQPSQLSEVTIRDIPIPAADLAGPILMHRQDHLDWHVLCLYALTNKGFENGVSFDTLGDLKRAIQLNEKCIGFGPHAVLVTKPQQFLARARGALKKLNCTWRMNLVDYYDETTFTANSPTVRFRSESAVAMSCNVNIVLRSSQTKRQLGHSHWTWATCPM